MASCQQQKLAPQEQNVTVCCKAYHNKYMDIKDGVVKLVDPPQVGYINWDKITFEGKTASSPVPFFLLVKDGKALARPNNPAPGDKLVLLDYKYDPFVEPERRMRWNHAQIKDVLEFTPICAAISIPPEKIFNLDVDESTLEVVLQTPKVKESQLWKISQVPPVI